MERYSKEMLDAFEVLDSYADDEEIGKDIRLIGSLIKKQQKEIKYLKEERAKLKEKVLDIENNVPRVWCDKDNYKDILAHLETYGYIQIETKFEDPIIVQLKKEY